MYYWEMYVTIESIRTRFNQNDFKGLSKYTGTSSESSSRRRPRRRTCKSDGHVGDTDNSLFYRALTP